MQVFLGSLQQSKHDCALCIGNFDGIHKGHRSMLVRLRTEANARGLPTALLTFEPHPREIFQAESRIARLSTLRDKLSLLDKENLLDYVFVHRFNTELASLSAEEFIQKILVERLRTKYLLIGDDFRFGKNRRGDFNLLSACNSFVTEAMPDVLVAGSRASSSLVRQALSDGNLMRAEQLLGRHYQLSGRVIYGRQLGRSIGFPTANLFLPHRKPALRGVFVVQVEGKFGQRGGVASLGQNPTVSKSKEFKLEVHLFNFAENLYGQRITVHFLKKIRDEKCFDNLDSLVAQIKNDAECAKVYLNSLQRETT